MTHPRSSDLSNADLLAVIERLQQQSTAMERLQQQQSTAMERMEQHHQAAIDELQSQVRRLQTENSFRSEVQPLPARGETRQDTTWRRPFGGRVTRLGVGMSLALLLLIAPSQSAVTHAGSEGATNTVYGFAALVSPGGDFNAAFGSYALHSNTSGYANTASGYEALYNNTTGNYDSASGYGALYSNTTGHNNVASGTNALDSNTTGSYNTASGDSALSSNATGINNTAVGYGAGETDSPINANITGSNNTFIGYNSGPGVNSQLDNATAIGANAVVSQSNSIVLGGIGDKTQRIGVGTTTPHSALQIAKGFLQIRPITGPPADLQCKTADDAGRLVVRTDGSINLYVCNGTTWIGK